MKSIYTLFFLCLKIGILNWHIFNNYYFYYYFPLLDDFHFFLLIYHRTFTISLFRSSFKKKNFFQLFINVRAPLYIDTCVYSVLKNNSQIFKCKKNKRTENCIIHDCTRSKASTYLKTV